MTFKGLFNLNCAVIPAMIPSHLRSYTADLCCTLDNLYSVSSFAMHSQYLQRSGFGIRLRFKMETFLSCL